VAPHFFERLHREGNVGVATRPKHGYSLNSRDDLVWSRKWNLPFIGYEHLALGGRVRKCETQAFRVIRSLM